MDKQPEINRPSRKLSGAAARSAAGEKGVGGRPKGSPNKVATEVREMVRIALDEAGGVNYLVGCAKKHPVAFLALVAKMMPARVEAEVGVIPGLAERLEEAERRIKETRGACA